MAVFFFVLVLGSCGSESDNSSQDITPTGGRLVLFNWEEYIGSQTIEKFTEKTGIEVEELFFLNEEQMLASVQSDRAVYDLIVSSDDSIREMIEAKLLAPIDYEKIPNFRHISESFTHREWDPEQKYSVPYFWGTTGVVINTKFIDEESNSYSVLFDERYRGKIAMLSNVWEVAAACAKYLGLSIASKDPGVWERVGAAMIAQQSLLLAYYDSNTIKKMLIDGELWAAQQFSGEGLAAADENEDLLFYIPVEGAAQWLDSFAIPRNAANPVAAHQFLNFILEPEINAAIASELWYATANSSAEAYIDPDVMEDESVNPLPEVVARLEFFVDVGENDRIVNRAWSEILAAQ